MSNKAISGLAMIVVLVFTVAPAMAEEAELPLHFDAIAANMSNIGPRGQARLQITIKRWSTDEERAKILEVLKNQSGRRDLANTLFGKESVGTIRETGDLAYDLRYARLISSEGAHMVVMATDRPIGFAETWRSSRTLDYNVSLVILSVDDEGRGEGQIMLGAEFSWDEANNQLVIENFASQPIRLTSVRMR